MGAKESCNRKAAVAERLCTVQCHAGEEAEAGRGSEGPFKVKVKGIDSLERRGTHMRHVL